MMRVMVNQRAEMERVEARILLEDLLEAWKHTSMFPASQGFLMIVKRRLFVKTQIRRNVGTLKVSNADVIFSLSIRFIRMFFNQPVRFSKF
jgi:hypothetical protein